MACPTCDHTMTNLGVEKPDSRRTFWCPRCGTIKMDWRDFESPKLVDYVYAFIHNEAEHGQPPAFGEFPAKEVAAMIEASGWKPPSYASAMHEAIGGTP